MAKSGLEKRQIGKKRKEADERHATLFSFYCLPLRYILTPASAWGCSTGRRLCSPASDLAAEHHQLPPPPLLIYDCSRVVAAVFLIHTCIIFTVRLFSCSAVRLFGCSPQEQRGGWMILRYSLKLEEGDKGQQGWSAAAGCYSSIICVAGPSQKRYGLLSLYF
eukprot:scaffold3850_cov101-Skeletonema_dohrnii-CCMP3373.AAC.4